MATGVGVRRWAAETLGPYFTQSIMIRAGRPPVTSGPYRYVRHTGYAGLLVSFVGLGFTLGNWLSVLVMAIGFFTAHLPRIRVKEKVSEAAFGDEYRDFKCTRKRLIPGIW